MSTVLTPTTAAVSNGVRLLTVADLAVFPSELPSGAVRYELDDGRLVIMPPPGDIHGAVDANLVTHLKIQGEWRGHGKVRTEVGVILRRNPDRLVGPDGVFIANRRLPLRYSPEGYLETIPDLVAEVRSKNDTQPDVERKVGEYLQAGVSVVWVADPAAATVTVYRPGQPPAVVAGAADLTVDALLPGVRVTVSDLFRV
jgi:Uma2 family endonuclease